MKNVIYKICEKLKGYSEEDEYFEVLQVEKNNQGQYRIVVQIVDTKSEKEAGDESNE